MPASINFKQLLEKTDFGDGTSIERYAVHLEGMTFRDILELGITPEDYNEKQYNDKRFKGGMGNLIEERFFGYKSNSDDRPDFPDAGVELKATCYDIRKRDHEPTAGERLVLTMVPFDRDVSLDFDSSHLWTKCKQILLIYYQRDRTVDKFDQQIKYVKLFTPPEEDLKIIRDDYRKIISYIQEGRADELSEGLTTYLGAATKGATEKTMWVTQHYPRVDADGSLTYHKAKKRAFSFKRQYMDYVLHHYLMNKQDDAESIVHEGDLDGTSFESYVYSLVARYIGKSDREIADIFSLPYTGNKAQWTTLAYRMLGIKNNHAEEFIKAGISVRVVRMEQNGHIRESLSFAPFEFRKLVQESWEYSPLHSYLEVTRFFFIVFQNTDGVYRLRGCKFWNMPDTDIESEVKRCWEETKKTIAEGVQLTIEEQANGKRRILNNLPSSKENRIAHVRPHASQSAYQLADGAVIGNLQRDASELPDGRWMTKQSFWINRSYMETVLADVYAGAAY